MLINYDLTQAFFSLANAESIIRIALTLTWNNGELFFVSSEWIKANPGLNMTKN
jgi:hypothetical protein